mgnify:CR=1 FL=1
MKRCSTGISITALVIALVALGFSLFQNRGMQWDSVMFAVAMLSGLVMFLIGWNIYSLIDLRNFRKEISDILDKQREEYVDLSSRVNKGAIGVNNSLMISMYMIYDDKNKVTREFCFVDYGIKAIGGYLRQGNVEGAQRVVDNLIVRIPELSLPIYPEQKIGMIEQLSEIKKVNGVEKIQNLPVLQKCILNWDVFPNNFE